MTINPAMAIAPDVKTPQEALRASELFGVLEPGEVEAVIGHAVKRRYRRSEVVLRRGDDGASMLVITEGRMRVGMTSEDGREVTLGIVGPGDILGEMSLLDGSPRSADVAALEDCSVLTLDRGRFFTLLRERPEIAIRMLGVLSRRLRRANAAVEEIALLDLPSRLARALGRLIKEHGRPFGKGAMRIELKLSQKDLSNLVGASREKVNRQLREWEEEGLLGKNDGYIVVLKPDELRLAYAEAEED